MSPGVIQVRADICGDCPTPCERQRDGVFHATPCAACHINRWSTWGDCRDVSKNSDKTDVSAAPVRHDDTIRGLGDLVAVVANPIARAIGLDKSKCGCARRQEALNKAFPFTRPE